MVAFRDVRGMTGIGPNGADPFDVFAVYLPTPEGGWILDPALQHRIASAQSLALAKVFLRDVFP